MTQEQALDILMMGHNVFLTGAAGSGKTYLINGFIRYCHEHGISVAITASTGIAATHIGGMTIHSWSGMGIRDTLTDDDIDDIVSREYLAKRFAKTSVLIIDEISMLSGGFLSNLDRLLQSARVSPLPFGGIQVVLVGDFFQLPPVSREREVEFAFEHPAWKTWNLAICALTTQYRQSNHLEKGGVPNLSRGGGLAASKSPPVRGEDFSSAKIRGDKNFSYNPKLISFARENRKEMNEPEKIFWYQILHQEALQDFHFRKQKPIGEYIVDFFCSELNLVVEIDGDSHREQEIYDIKRTAYFLSLGLREIRFTNKEVIESTEGVFEKLS